MITIYGSQYVQVERSSVRRLLEALCHTVFDDYQYVFSDAVERFEFEEMNMLRSRAWFFQPSFIDPDSICSKVFVVCGGLVSYIEPTPDCPHCGSPITFEEDCSTPFRRRYRCSRPWTKSKECRQRNVSCRRCRGSVMPSVDTWVGGVHDVGLSGRVANIPVV